MAHKVTHMDQIKIQRNWPKKMDKPKVSIACFTYNDENYINQAIDNILMQITDFPFEIIIGDDFSSDSTYEKLLRYKEKYPDLIKIFRNNENKGRLENWLSTLRECRGSYIAMCDGDDYWTDSKKLFKQVNILENYPEYSGLYHSVNVVNKDLQVIGSLPKKGEDFIGISQFIESWYEIPTCSVMFRNFFLESEINKHSLIFRNLKYVVDYSLDILIVERGIYKFIDENMADYRIIRDSDSFSSMGELEIRSDILRSRDNVNLHLGYKYNNLINKSKERSNMLLLLKIYRDEGAQSFFSRFINLKLINKYKFLRDLISYSKRRL